MRVKLQMSQTQPTYSLCSLPETPHGGLAADVHASCHRIEVFDIGKAVEENAAEYVGGDNRIAHVFWLSTAEARRHSC